MSKMTLAKAAEIYVDRKQKMDQLKAELEEASTLLKEHFRKTGRSTYKDTISYSVSTRTLMDNAKVKALLGARLPNFQRTIEVEQLSILQ